MAKKKVCIILYNIRSVYNTASIFRTADCAGVDKIYLYGTTPSPEDRFGRKRKDFHKVALGAEKSVYWEKIDSAKDKIKDLKKDGFTIVSLEQNNESIDYNEVKIEDNLCVILGNEVEGVPDDILKLSDIICEIKMMGEKESLNVSVSAGIFVFRILNI